jgi:predicted dehydrogenase
MRDRLRVGLIGLGAISYAHEAGYAELGEACQLTALCDIDELEASSRASAAGAAPYTDYAALVAQPDVDLVDITAPHLMHYPIARAALLAGKHVLVEKPIAVTSQQGAELIALATKRGLTFGVAENTRFVTAYQQALPVLQSGQLGEIRTVRTLIAGSEVHRIKNPRLWHGKAPYGGVILDSAVHHFYLFKWWFGGVRDLQAFASRIVPESEVEDNAVILGHLPGGAEFQLSVSCTIEIPWTERVEVYGSTGGMVIDQLADPVVKVYAGGDDFDGAPLEGVPADPLGWKFNSMLAEIRDFVSAVRDGRPPLVDARDALYALAAAEAAVRSATAGESVCI